MQLARMERTLLKLERKVQELSDGTKPAEPAEASQQTPTSEAAEQPSLLRETVAQPQSTTPLAVEAEADRSSPLPKLMNGDVEGKHQDKANEESNAQRETNEVKPSTVQIF